MLQCECLQNYDPSLYPLERYAMIFIDRKLFVQGTIFQGIVFVQGILTRISSDLI